jgi:NitT/TauT family transport system substrate-binding protein
MIAKKSSGIQKPSDLRGKKIGLVTGSISEFFLGTFLAFNDLSPSSVHLVSLPPAEMTEALSKGAVDAIINWNPYTFETKKRLGGNSISWLIQREQSYYLLLISNGGFLGTKPEVVKKFLQSLLRAEEYVKNHQLEAQELVQKNCGFDLDDIAAIWQKTSYQVRLPQNLLLLMEDETRWLQEKKSQKSKIPDFFSHIDLQSLSAIKPEAVGIIH